MTTTPLPPGHTRRRPAPPVDLADDAREEAVARAMKMWDGTTSSDSSEEWFRGLAAAAIAADDAWRAGQDDPCDRERQRLAAALIEIRDWDSAAAARHGHIGVRDYAGQVLAALAPADHEPAAAIQSLPDRLRELAATYEGTVLTGANAFRWAADLVDAAVSGVQPAAPAGDRGYLYDDTCPRCRSGEHVAAPTPDTTSRPR